MVVVVLVFQFRDSLGPRTIEEEFEFIPIRFSELFGRLQPVHETAHIGVRFGTGEDHDRCFRRATSIQASATKGHANDHVTELPAEIRVAGRLVVMVVTIRTVEPANERTLDGLRECRMDVDGVTICCAVPDSDFIATAASRMGQEAPGSDDVAAEDLARQSISTFTKHSAFIASPRAVSS